jgi:hypothetical protein
VPRPSPNSGLSDVESMQPTAPLSYHRLRGTFVPVFCSPATVAPRFSGAAHAYGGDMNGLIYLVGLIVVVLFILSVLGLR